MDATVSSDASKPANEAAHAESVAKQHYDRGYYAEVTNPMLIDETFYPIRAQAALHAYFSCFAEPRGWAGQKAEDREIQII